MLISTSHPRQIFLSDRLGLVVSFFPLQLKAGYRSIYPRKGLGWTVMFTSSWLLLLLSLPCARERTRVCVCAPQRMEGSPVPACDLFSMFQSWNGIGRGQTSSLALAGVMNLEGSCPRDRLAGWFKTRKESDKATNRTTPRTHPFRFPHLGLPRRDLDEVRLIGCEE